MYVRFWFNTPYCGTYGEEYREVKDDTTGAELDMEAEELAQFNAEGYEYLVTGWDDEMFEDEDEAAEAVQDYYADCDGGWQIISKEEYEDNI